MTMLSVKIEELKLTKYKKTAPRFLYFKGQKHLYLSVYDFTLLFCWNNILYWYIYTCYKIYSYFKHTIYSQFILLRMIKQSNMLLCIIAIIALMSNFTSSFFFKKWLLQSRCPCFAILVGIWHSYTLYVENIILLQLKHEKYCFFPLSLMKKVNEIGSICNFYVINFVFCYSRGINHWPGSFNKQ